MSYCLTFAGTNSKNEKKLICHRTSKFIHRGYEIINNTIIIFKLRKYVRNAFTLIYFFLIAYSHDIYFSFSVIFLQPKTRPAILFPSRYASLPSHIQKPIESDQQQPGNNIYIGRDFIGIRINDVHNAVLKSGARMPGKFSLFSSNLIKIQFTILNVKPFDSL